MQSDLLVSIIIPVHGRHELLRRALTSIDAQRPKESEIIVVDDGSATPIDLCARPGLTLVRHAQNRGAAAARNTAMALARGKYVAFLDSDDIWREGKLGAQVSLLARSDANVIGVFSGFIREGNPSRPAGTRLIPDDWFRYFLMGCRVAPGSTLLARREMFDLVGPQDEALRRYEDWDWLLRAARRFRFAFCDGDGVVIGRSPRPRFGDVLDSLSKLESKWLAHLEGRHHRRFSSALMVERAAVSGWQGNHVRMLHVLAKAVAKDPGVVAANLVWRVTGQLPVW